MRHRGGGQLSRTEVVTVRFDQRLRYLMEIAARRQRRTVSSFVETAVEKALSEVKLDDTQTVIDAAQEIWDVDKHDRLVKLAKKFPHLLTYEEELSLK